MYADNVSLPAFICHCCVPCSNPSTSAAGQVTAANCRQTRFHVGSDKQTDDSASEVKTLWQYTNLFIIIIIIMNRQTEKKMTIG